MRKKQQRKRGAARMTENGYHPVQCWLDASEWGVIRQAAEARGLPVATFVRRAAFDVAADYLASAIHKERLTVVQLAEAAKKELGA